MMNKAQLLQKLTNLSGLFFNTPLIEFDVLLRKESKKIYAKYEAPSFSGSIKDRMAFFIFKHAYESGQLQAGQPIIEVTSGNTGIAIAGLGRALGHEVTIVMPDWLSKERYAIMTLTGAKLIKLSEDEGGFIGSISMAHALSKQYGMYYPDQFSHHSNLVAHLETTAPELTTQLNTIGLSPDHFIAGVGTGGTVMGFDAYFKKNNISCACYPLEPENSPTLSTGGKKIGSHRLQGISDEFIPDLVSLNSLASIVSVDDSESIGLAEKVNKMGLSVGISSGANLLGAMKVLESNDSDVVTTVLPDSSFKYISTDLYQQQKYASLVERFPFKITGYRAYRSSI